MNLKTTLILTVITTLIILSAGCIDNDFISESEPEYTDTDGDGWSDSTERACGTNPYLKDTDGDGITDPYDRYPLIPYIKPIIKDISPIPNDYYTPNEEVSKHFIKDEKLFRYLSYFHWDHNTRYTRSNHDCSQQTARMEHDLKNAGVDCFIRTGVNLNYNCGHAWVMIMYEGEYVAYECTDHPYFDEPCFFVFPPSSHRLNDLYTSRKGKIKHDNSYYEEDYGWDILTDYKDMNDIWENFDDDLKLIGWNNGKYKDQFISEWGWWINEDDYNIPWNDLRN